MPDPGRTAAARALLVLLLVGAAALLLHGPIPQDPAYHAFADRRPLLGVPNAGDVLSNLPFVVVGAVGLSLAARAGRGPTPAPRWERAGLAVYATGVALTAVGSAAYHWAPSDHSLVLDRLPMTVAFSAFFALVLGERLGEAAGRRALLPLVAAGLSSVAIWSYTLGLSPGGDLRAYALVKGVPALGTLVLVGFVREPRRTVGPLVATLAAYGVATALEAEDHAVFAATSGAVSGHTLKHLAAAGATAFPLVWFRRRRGL